MGPSEAQNPSSKERFLREARAAFKLRHPHVVEVFDAAEINGVSYIAVRLLAGCSLDERLRRGPELSVREALRVTREAALGLAAAHALGLIHRELFCELLDEPFKPFAAEQVLGAVEGRGNPADPRAARARTGRGWWLWAAALVAALVAGGAGAALALK